MRIETMYYINDSKAMYGINKVYHWLHFKSGYVNITQVLPPLITRGIICSARRYIAFLDPHAKFLPEYGYPSKKRKGVKIDFMKTNFGSSFPNQCYPYMAIEGCDFTKKFKGTLFRLPLRTRVLAEQSKISQEEIKISNIRKKFSNIQSNKEKLFLRNIESCSFYNIEGGETQLIWQSQIRNIKSCREDRQNIVDNIIDAPIYQLNIERNNYKNKELRTKTSEIWLLCTGGHDDFDQDLMERKPRGGVASFLAQSNDKSDESFDNLEKLTPNPPKLEGEVFSYLSLPISTNLGVHLNGNFSLTSARRGNDIHRIFWTEANGGQFISLEDAKIFSNKEEIIVDILVSSGISAVMLEEDKIKQLNEIIEPGESEFPYKPDMIVDEQDEYTHDDLFKLLVLRDKNSYEILSGLPLVPLSNGLVGKFGEDYYVGHEFLDLFPDIGPSKFVSANSVLKPVRELKWNSNGKSLPDRRWFERIWLILNNDASNIDFDKLSKFPILSTIKPSNMLVRPDISNPLIQNGNSLFSLFDILVKLKVRFTDMAFPESAHEDLKKCVNECTTINIINSLERARLSLTMERLFEKSKLSSSKCEKFRTFIKDELKILIAHARSQRGFMEILKSLPIWPIHSSENKLIDATSGDLPPQELPFFSFHKKTNFYRCDHESDFNALTELGVTPMDTLEYLKGIVKQVDDESDELEPSQDYVVFLQSVLSLRDREIEKYLGQKEIIPNKPLSDFVNVDTLYDMSVPVLRSIFHDTDKYFLPPELQNNTVCLKALKRMGLISTAMGVPLPKRNNLYQKDALLTSLLDKLTVEPDDDYHDAVFIVGEERKTIRANRYVLSAASKKFEEKFRDNINEIEIEFHQDVFKVFLQLLYGQTFRAATIPILSTASDFKTEHEFKTHYLSFLIDLLKLTVSYEVKPLRNKVEDAIMEGFFEAHIKTYRNPINKQLRKNAVNETEKSEISKISRMLQPFLQN
ncbi:unnamed protein product [Rhizophagus irregularis]|nr:unnamed protein product [Rhizophagus irregularis]